MSNLMTSLRSADSRSSCVKSDTLTELPEIGLSIDSISDWQSPIYHLQKSTHKFSIPIKMLIWPSDVSRQIPNWLAITTINIPIVLIQSINWLNSIKLL